MVTLVLCLMAVSFGFGASLTWIVRMIRNRHAIPRWATMTDANGRFGGER